MQLSEEELEQQARYNVMLLEVARLVHGHFNTRIVLELVASESKTFGLRESLIGRLKSRVQSGCIALYEKIYSQFMTSFQDQVIFTIQQVFAPEALPSASDQASVMAWKSTTQAQIFDYFLPQKIADFNCQFAVIQSKVNQFDKQSEGESLELKVMEHLDRILHYFCIRYLMATEASQ